MPAPTRLPPPTMPVHQLELHVLGSSHWVSSRGDRGAIADLDAALMAMLALHGPTARDTVARRLWPEATPTRAANNLRKHVQRLRSRTAQDVFSTGATIAFAANTDIDVRRIATLPPDDLVDAELLAGFDYAGHVFLEKWVAERRQSVRILCVDALAAHAEALERNDEVAAAIRLAERIVDLSPLHEHAVRRVMRLHVRRGDHTAAVAAFESFERRLHDETGARPGAETRQFLDMVEGRLAVAHPAAKTVPLALVHPPVLVGRTDAWGAMGQAWADAHGFLLLGEAGSGKSRLLRDFTRHRDGIAFERGRAGDADTPFGLLARLLRSVAATGVPSPRDFVRRELARLLPEWGPSPKAPAHEGALRHAVELYLTGALANGLRGLVIDDLDVADLASVETLRWLSASTLLEPLRVGLAARSWAAPAIGSILRDWLDDSFRPIGIDLPPLEPADVETLLASLGLPEFDSPGLAMRLHAHAGGNVLFVLETLKQAWRHGDTKVLGHPATVQAMIDRRLLDLPASALDLLRVAAVCGPDFSAERAAALLGTSALQSADAWSVLVRANILHGERFAHSLIAERALQLVPAPVRRALHASVAELLAGESNVVPARVAEHWQDAEHWHAAGEWWQRAAARARHAGRLAEQHALAERAADGFRRSGDDDASFDALLATSDSVQLRHGGAAALAALPRLEALARDATRRSHCKLVQAEAWLDLERGAEALAAADDALAMTHAVPSLQADAMCLRSMAFGQLGRPEEALAAGRLASAAAQRAENPTQQLRTARAFAFALYQIDRFGEALFVQRRVLELAQGLGDLPDVAAAEASAAALLGITGDIASSVGLARRAQATYAEMGMAHNSTNGAINLCVLGRAAACLGQMDEASRALEAAVAMAGVGAAVSVQGKARVTLASLRLVLGDAKAARELAAMLPDAAPPGLHMQAAWILACADRMEHRDGHEHLARLAALAEQHPDPPLRLSAWVEWSYQGDAAPVVRRLRTVRHRFERLGAFGIARSLQLRETGRLLDIDSDAAVRIAERHARVLMPLIDSGLHPGSYPPEGWDVLARALQRAGAKAQAEECRRRGRDWILQVALPNVPAPDRDAFVGRNPVNRQLLSSPR